MPQGNPRPDPVPSPRQTMVQRFWRILRLLILLSVVIAAIAVVLVTSGDANPTRDANRNRAIRDDPSRNRASGPPPRCPQSC